MTAVNELSGPLVTALCVTKDRPEFIPLLWWNFEKQTWPNRRLLIVDGSGAPPERGTFLKWRKPTGSWYARFPGSNIPEARNLLLEESRGGICCWFDDDDWQHPRRLEIAARGPWPHTGSHSWFLDLPTQRAAKYRWDGWHNGLAFINHDGVPRYDESREVGEDGPWLRKLPGNIVQIPSCLNFWLSHDRNRCNRSGTRNYTYSLEDVKRDVGPEAWGDTDVQLQALRVRLDSRNSAP